MSSDLLLSIVAGGFVCLAMLFISMIHLFMIPKEIMDRDTKPRKPAPPRNSSLQKDMVTVEESVNPPDGGSGGETGISAQSRMVSPGDSQ